MTKRARPPGPTFVTCCSRCLRSSTAASLAAGRDRSQNHIKNTEALIEDDGDITLGAVGPIECAATAADGHNSLAMLVRRDGETFNALLKRLDRAIARYFDTGETPDKINPPSE